MSKLPCAFFAKGACKAGAACMFVHEARKPDRRKPARPPASPRSPVPAAPSTPPAPRTPPARTTPSSAASTPSPGGGGGATPRTRAARRELAAAYAEWVEMDGEGGAALRSWASVARRQVGAGGSACRATALSPHAWAGAEAEAALGVLARVEGAGVALERAHVAEVERLATHVRRVTLPALADALEGVQDAADDLEVGGDADLAPLARELARALALEVYRKEAVVAAVAAAVHTDEGAEVVAYAARQWGPGAPHSFFGAELAARAAAELRDRRR